MLVIQNTSATTTTTSGNSASTTFPFRIFVNGFVVVAVQTASTTNPATSVTDSDGETYTQLGTPVINTSTQLQFFYKHKSTTGNAITVTANYVSAPNLPFVFAWEVKGQDLTSPINTSATGTGTGTVASTANFAIAEQGDLILTCVTRAATDTYSAQAGNILDSAGIQVANGAETYGGAENKLASAASASVIASMTGSDSSAWSAIAVILKPLQSPSTYAFNYVADGDSITQGYGVTTPWTNSLSLNAGPWCITNQGISGGTIVKMTADAPVNIDTLFVSGATNILSIWGGTNDIAVSNLTPAQVFSDIQTYVTARKAVGWKVIVIPPVSRGGGVGGNEAALYSLLTATPLGDAQIFLPYALSGTITVGSLGRHKVAGNSQTHALYLINSATHAIAATVTVDMSKSASADGLVYGAVSLVTPVPNTKYTLLSYEVSGKDTYWDQGTFAITWNAALAAQYKAVYNSGGPPPTTPVEYGSAGVGNTYGPVNFLDYTGTSWVTGFTAGSAVNSFTGGVGTDFTTVDNTVYSNTTYFQADQTHPTQLSDTTIIAPTVSTAINSFILPAPAPASLSQATGVQGSTIATFTVTGTNFDGAGTSILSFSGVGITVNSYGTRNATILVANITIANTATVSVRDVIVTNADTQTGTLIAAFTVSSGIYSQSDCRNYGNFPNASRSVNGTLIYDVQTSSNPAVPGTDSRKAGIPVASGTYPQNSRTPGTYGPGE